MDLWHAVNCITYFRQTDGELSLFLSLAMHAAWAFKWPDTSLYSLLTALYSNSITPGASGFKLTFHLLYDLFKSVNYRP